MSIVLPADLLNVDGLDPAAIPLSSLAKPSGQLQGVNGLLPTWVL